MAYFDNAATTYPKPETVYSFMDQFYRAYGGSAGRGSYKLAQTAGTLIADTRKEIQGLLHCPAKQVIFTPTDTIGLNIIIQGLINSGIQSVYITPFEHNAVTRILYFYEKFKHLKIQQLAVTKELKYDLKKIQIQFENIKPELIIMSHASNVCGLIAPVEEISILAKRFGATVVIDMAQTAGLIDCNVGLETIDFAVFAGHKTLYGPTGISGFVMKPDFILPPVLFGGTGYDSANQNMPDSLPERLEMGTLNIAGIAGLNAAIKWIKEVSISELRRRETINRRLLLDLLQEYDFISIIGQFKDCEYVGVVSCLIDGISSDIAGNIFSQQGISVRTGLHCAPLAHKFLKTYPAGTIRFSVSYFTNAHDFQELRRTLDYIEENL